MNNGYLINGLKQLMNDETEDIYYFSEGMLDDNVIIQESTLIYDDKNSNPKIESMISVKYINNVAGIDLDAADYTLYWGDLLAPIQTYRIIKDIYDLYLTLNKEKFIETMYNLSTSSYSSSIQSDEKHAQHILIDIRDTFDFVKNAI
jgi:hypothetical protein